MLTTKFVPSRRALVAQLKTSYYLLRITFLPSRSTSPYTTAARGEPLVVTHDQLRLDLVDRVHGYANHDQQRGTAKVKVHVQATGDPGGQVLEERPHRTVQVVQVDTRNHPLGDERDQNQIP